MRTDYEETVRDVIKRMSEIQKLDLTRDKKLYESLLYHLPPMILRLQNNIQIVNPMLDNIKQEYPELFYNDVVCTYTNRIKVSGNINRR